ncbi:hypothetical protein H4R20_005329 [Coemansia guatemalensis]|uniref:Uncharacterized protein n=1 Tax=Coemansia guatemalensis TaxID=2761395 RepID=A0A9W8LR84_9FUNG|nr:hypothetical protein H4R20_005329 [Coemansia guatemalensis]
MGYMYPKHAASSSESPERPAKRRCTDKGKVPEWSAFSTEAEMDTAVTSELPTVAALPRGFPPPPSGYELLFEAWGNKWRETHGAARASGDLQIKLAEFIEAARMVQDSAVETLRSADNELSQDIAKLQKKLREVRMNALLLGEPADPEYVKSLEDLINEFTADLTSEEERLAKAVETLGKTRGVEKLGETRQVIQELLKDQIPATSQLRYNHIFNFGFRDAVEDFQEEFLGKHRALSLCVFPQAQVDPTNRHRPRYVADEHKIGPFFRSEIFERARTIVERLHLGTKLSLIDGNPTSHAYMFIHVCIHTEPGVTVETFIVV